MNELIYIENINIPELHPYLERSEKQLFHLNEPNIGVFVAESPNVIFRAIEDGYKPISFLACEDQLSDEVRDMISNHPYAPCYIAKESMLKDIVGYQMTRGLLALFNRRPLRDVNEIIKNRRRICVLDEIMNPTNVGAIFRSAAALGVDAIILTKGTSDPLYRRSARVSMGTVFQIPWTFVENDWKNTLHELDFKLVATALTDRSISISDPRLKQLDKMAIVLGTEGFGLSEQTISACDYTVKIPMTHGVDSLNVAAASAVIFWELASN